MSGKGHPLPRSDEARHNEIPEHLEEEKGCGDDAKAAIQPAGEAVGPDGEPYRYDVAQESGAPAMPGGHGGPDNGDLTQDRGPGNGPQADALAEDQAAHQDRGQSIAEQEADRG